MKRNVAPPGSLRLRTRPPGQVRLGKVAKWPAEVRDMAAQAGRADDKPVHVRDKSGRARRVVAPIGATRRFKQARSERTYQALLAAAADIFAEGGYDAAQTPEIARRAGVSTGAFYRYFEDKREIFLEVCGLRLDDSIAEVIKELRPERFTGEAGSSREAIDVVLDVIFARIRRDAPIERVFLAMSFRDPEVMAMRARFELLGVDVLTRVIEEVIPRSVVPRARAAALVIHAAALEIALERAGLSPTRGLGLTDGDVREALREMIHRYLFPGAR